MPQPTLLLVTGLPGSGKTRLASAAADDLGAPVVGHDWVMAALRGRPEVWEAMQSLDHLAFRTVGWSIMWNVATAQLREDRSVILDGVARAPEVAATRDIAYAAGSRSIVVLTTIDDAKLHEQRVAGRFRAIPGWPELTWEDVQRTRATWRPPDDVDLVLSADRAFESNLVELQAAIGSASTTNK